MPHPILKPKKLNEKEELNRRRKETRRDGNLGFSTSLHTINQQEEVIDHLEFMIVLFLASTFKKELRCFLNHRTNLAHPLNLFWFRKMFVMQIHSTIYTHLNKDLTLSIEIITTHLLRSSKFKP